MLTRKKKKEINPEATKNALSNTGHRMPVIQCSPSARAVIKGMSSSRGGGSQGKETYTSERTRPVKEENALPQSKGS